jgi:hypothetical protein
MKYKRIAPDYLYACKADACRVEALRRLGNEAPKVAFGIRTEATLEPA